MREVRVLTLACIVVAQPQGKTLLKHCIVCVEPGIVDDLVIICNGAGIICFYVKTVANAVACIGSYI